jgi:glycerol-3-phosphate acyltransferase PlsY
MVLAYLIGSVPSSVWIGRYFFATDIREFGSKNAGASNTFRILGWKAGSIVLLLDISKGYLAVELVKIFQLSTGDDQIRSALLILAGLMAVLGHIFPIYIGFKGGKGVAVALGVLLAIAPYPALLSFLVFVLVMSISHFSSLGSISAAISFPVFIHFFYHPCPISFSLFSISTALIIIITHRFNIQRLLQGNERKTYLKKSKREQIDLD